MRKLLIALAVLLSCSSSLHAQTLCESLGGAYRECRVASSGRIRLIMEISDRLCHEDLTWGSNQIGIVWVKGGCRATFGVAKPISPKANAASRVVCESIDGNRQVCPAETINGVIFAQQLSKTDCIEGTSWGWDLERGLVWVDHGCRAEFVLGGTPQPVDPSIRFDTPVLCESRNGKRTTCKADTSAGVRIVNPLSDSACGYGREWGYDENGIWVTKGCRAEFVVRGKPKAMLSALVCESQDGARNHCAADTRYGVAIFERLGESDCILGESWGFDETGVWVDAGCRAQFALGGYRLPADNLPANASKVTCESVDGGHKPCPADTSRGVGLLRQISDADCVLNRTWGYDRDSIWVTNGCRAEFAVAR